MGHILLLDSVVPKPKAILAALTWITSAENLSKGQKGWVLAAKKALSIRWDGRSCQGWNHIDFVRWLPSFFLLTLGPSAVPKRDTWRNLSTSGGIFPLAYCKNTGGQRFFFLFLTPPLVGRCIYKANSGEHLGTCASHLPWGHPFLDNTLFLQMTGFQPCLHPTDAGGTIFSRVTAQLCGVGMWWQGWQGYWVHR